MKPSDLITPEQAAALMGVSVRRVQQYCAAGRLGFTVGSSRIRRRYMIYRKKALAFRPNLNGRPKANV